jgi:Glycosyl transferase family 11
MKENSGFVAVALTGGLGNQLFQFAAGLHFAKSTSSKLIVNTTLGAPKGRDINRPDLLELFSANESLLIQSKAWPPNAMRIFNVLLSRGVDANSIGRKTEIAFLKLLAERIFIRSEPNRLKIYVANDLGHVDTTRIPNHLLIGYFQTYRYFENPGVRDLMRNFGHSNVKIKMQYETLAELEQPLIVHVRRGDYRNEQRFGLLSSEYYQEAIKRQFELYGYKKVWLFSDEPSFAMSLISAKIGKELRVFDNSRHSPALTLDLMRMGRGFVLANSSFGYWAAQLSNASNMRIFAPKPWFMGMVEPRDLIHPEWERINAIWEK